MCKWGVNVTVLKGVFHMMLYKIYYLKDAEGQVSNGKVCSVTE